LKLLPLAIGHYNDGVDQSASTSRAINVMAASEPVALDYSTQVASQMLASSHQISSTVPV
jgi:hypothetical protein